MLEVRIEKVNGLSTKLNLKKRIENNNGNKKLIKKEQTREMIKVVVERLKIILVEKIKKKMKKQ